MVFFYKVSWKKYYQGTGKRILRTNVRMSGAFFRLRTRMNILQKGPLRTKPSSIYCSCGSWIKTPWNSISLLAPLVSSDFASDPLIAELTFSALYDKLEYLHLPWFELPCYIQDASWFRLPKTKIHTGKYDVDLSANIGFPIPFSKLTKRDSASHYRSRINQDGTQLRPEFILFRDLSLEMELLDFRKNSNIALAEALLIVWWQ